MYLLILLIIGYYGAGLSCIYYANKTNILYRFNLFCGIDISRIILDYNSSYYNIMKYNTLYYILVYTYNLCVVKSYTYFKLVFFYAFLKIMNNIIAIYAMYIPNNTMTNTILYWEI